MTASPTFGNEKSGGADQHELLSIIGSIGSSSASDKRARADCRRGYQGQLGKQGLSLLLLKSYEEFTNTVNVYLSVQKKKGKRLPICHS